MRSSTSSRVTPADHLTSAPGAPGSEARGPWSWAPAACRDVRSAIPSATLRGVGQRRDPEASRRPVHGGQRDERLMTRQNSSCHHERMDATLVLGQQGRLVIPAEVRSALGLSAGDRLHL
ncbi:AbrB/MazE/SpoVT family DNA-binding domain-containing protein, partial [Quadrisphaera oryzae]|uniref:AbrB/MazE/SpoVT family DNA-binding domain-containing protein n=1 Tax=Quadrisphaera sp. RL12-1S TaxID=2763011 RepID=UPI001C95177A